MNVNIYIFFIQCIVYLSQHEFTNGKALIGRNIRQARLGEFSYVVSLMRIDIGHPHSGGEHFCNGALVSPRDIVTASHCVMEEDLQSVQMIIGTIDLRNGTIVHPYWWQNYDHWATVHNITIDFTMNDVACIRLFSEVGVHIRPIALTTYSNIQLYGQTVTMAGWGINNRGVLPSIMNTAEVKITENRKCEQRLFKKTGIPVMLDVRFFCTFVTPYVLIESGDSGGPLIFRERLIGVNKGTCPGDDGITKNAKQVNIHMGIQHYKTFIESEINSI